MTEKVSVSARELARILGVHQPTAEQIAIIEAPLEGVYRVVAGAGSGKTETMALRVVWLVANGFVAPHQVLGLTFTRKAAGELSHRINERIRALPSSDDAPTDVFQMPQVSTYNSFASRLFQDYSVYLGIDSEQDVAGQAAAWALARKVVVHATLPGLEGLDYSADRLATLTWQLAQAMSEHNVSPEALLSHATEMAALSELPLGSKFSFESDMGHILGSQELLPVLVHLVAEFQAEKRRRAMVEYSDQVRLALDVITRAPDVIESLRQRYAVVLLDEYQDTSVLQTHLLKTLFVDHPVMSVGDPHQAIYGWRGASAGNFADFDRDFRVHLPGGTFGLNTSWRNPTSVLDAANTVAGPLRHSVVHDVGVLSPRPDAPSGVLDLVYSDTVEDEAEAVADWFATKLQSDSPPSAALLVRHRTHQAVFARALERRGVPVHILGIGGLLADPVVAEMVCALAVVHRPHANGELVRLLTSGASRVGVADLENLSKTARWLATRDSSGAPLDEQLQHTLDEQALGLQAASLQDALDYLVRHPDSHHSWRGFSEQAKRQLRHTAAMIDELRRFGHEPLLDQIAHFERVSLLDIERIANPARDSSREARETFFDAVRQYQVFAEDSGPAGFLDWLEQAEWRDSLTPRSEPAEPGCVQILTIHGAKGLEWDLVAVVRAVDEELPGKPKEGTYGWLTPGVLPYSFRGDAGYLPEFSWRQASTRKELVDNFKAFRAQVAAHHLAEERRLAYVAMTRARAALLLSGSWWASQVKPRKPSVFLHELAEAALIPPLPQESSLSEKPEDTTEMISWPNDPLGSRRNSVAHAAEAVILAIEENVTPTDEHRTLIDRVLAEEAERAQPATSTWPVRIPASQFDRWVFEPEQMLRQRLQPRPSTVGVAQQRGTVFHEWVESFFQQSGRGVILGDIDPDSPVEAPLDVDITSWQSAFARSPFAHLRPVALEREIHYPLAEHLIICKIDAVFEVDGRVLIIDWKTGKKPQTPDQIQRKALQLALYRLAWADWSGSPLEQVDAAFWFSGSAETLKPEILPSAAELADLLERAKKKSS